MGRLGVRFTKLLDKKFGVFYNAPTLKQKGAYMLIHILSYSDGMYPEDNEIIGAYSDWDLADRIRSERISDYSHTEMNRGKAWNYTITSIELTSVDEVL